jgi:hypothetical protein
MRGGLKEYRLLRIVAVHSLPLSRRWPVHGRQGESPITKTDWFPLDTNAQTFRSIAQRDAAILQTQENSAHVY